MRKHLPGVLAAALIACIQLVGCVQMPTEKAGIPDVRPQISFRLIDESVRSAHIFIDGIHMGTAADYMDGVAALRLLPGTHMLKVTFMGATLMEEKFYVGDGVQRTFTVNREF
ncbi:hypothetical protein [Ramlibacter alkalitolerans]|uniref:PEGA domain-containing protein n=1 Tax=Ramlibacter alkalitolerans TaxID=2039631 RepID=A0ABS1JL62_9BURK|nr:hypothetical protein [Ramlibacter alkalitolerans]MBL0424651.1 hypothetical protein [Ramlibacter alkalitolerans]